ncbi:MAG: DUF6265 family protein [Fimbriimonadaceae bacterium]
MPATLIKSYTKPVPATIDQLAWLTGAWHGLHDGFWAEELWSKPYQGTILGSYRRHSDKQLVVMDIIHILEQNEYIKLCFRRVERAYEYSEQLNAPAVFTLASVTDNDCIFVNDDQAHPYWIYYKREESILTGLTCDSLEQLDFISKYRYEKYL